MPLFGSIMPYILPYENGEPVIAIRTGETHFKVISTTFLLFLWFDPLFLKLWYDDCHSFQSKYHIYMTCSFMLLDGLSWHKLKVTWFWKQKCVTNGSLYHLSSYYNCLIFVVFIFFRNIFLKKFVYRKFKSYGIFTVKLSHEYSIKYLVDILQHLSESTRCSLLVSNPLGQKNSWHLFLISGVSTDSPIHSSQSSSPSQVILYAHCHLWRL